jgi:hypothetical protein
MADELSKREPQDAARINVNKLHEVRYWTQTLDFTEQQLRSAVAAAGVEVKKIRTYVRLRWRSVGLPGSEGGRCKSVGFGRESACCRREPRRRATRQRVRPPGPGRSARPLPPQRRRLMLRLAMAAALPSRRTGMT